MRTFLTAILITLMLSFSGCKPGTDEAVVTETPASTETDTPASASSGDADNATTQVADAAKKAATPPPVPAKTPEAVKPAATEPAAMDGELSYVRMAIRNMGEVVIELNHTKAPKTCDNFLAYVQEGYYSDTVFHRIIKNFMIQGGGFIEGDGTLIQKTTSPPVVNESGNGLTNKRGAIAMARTRAPDSATSQFFINVKDNFSLDQPGPRFGGSAYAVFGRVVAGMDVVDRVKEVQVGTGSITNQTGLSSQAQSVPAEPVVIQSIEQISADDARSYIDG